MTPDRSDPPMTEELCLPPTIANQLNEILQVLAINPNPLDPHAIYVMFDTIDQEPGAFRLSNYWKLVTCIFFALRQQHVPISPHQIVIRLKNSAKLHVLDRYVKRFRNLFSISVDPFTFTEYVEYLRHLPLLRQKSSAFLEDVQQIFAHLEQHPSIGSGQHRGGWVAAVLYLVGIFRLTPISIQWLEDHCFVSHTTISKRITELDTWLSHWLTTTLYPTLPVTLPQEQLVQKHSIVGYIMHIEEHNQNIMRITVQQDVIGNRIASLLLHRDQLARLVEVSPQGLWQMQQSSPASFYIQLRRSLLTIRVQAYRDTDEDPWQVHVIFD